MLETRNICLEVEGEEEPLFLLNNVNFCVPKGHFMAIVGPSGCGKTTLLKSIAGIMATTSGSFFWEGRDLAEEGDFKPYEIGYVPQFSIAYDELTVDESIECSARLRVKGDEDEINDLIDSVLEETGLTEIADRQVKRLSGGQKRRLALAMELVSHPRVLLCDEVTSGLDPRSEREIVELLHNLSRKEGRIVISVTHSLAQMEMYDSIMVLVKGNLAYHGSPNAMIHYFGVQHVEDVYPQLSLREPEAWSQSWLKHRADYYRRMEAEHVEKYRLMGQEPPVEGNAAGDDDEEEEEESPSFFCQFFHLLKRRFTILSRDKTQLILQLVMIIVFPILVALFSSKGQEQLHNLTDQASNDIAAEVQQQQSIAETRAKVGSAQSGIIMFEIILLGLMGSNNSAREIAGERQIVEKEKFAGTRPSAYISSKLVYLAVLVLVQSLWMYLFVQYFWPLRGDTWNHLGFLLLANAAMTTVCLGISANCKNPDQASLLSIYLVGFQLPLSGAVLALPTMIESVTQPFISAYWAWSGSVMGLDNDVLKAVNGIVQTSFSEISPCHFVLAAHVVVGIVLAYIGARRERWE